MELVVEEYRPDPSLYVRYVRMYIVEEGALIKLCDYIENSQELREYQYDVEAWEREARRERLCRELLGVLKALGWDARYVEDIWEVIGELEGEAEN